MPSSPKWKQEDSPEKPLPKLVELLDDLECGNYSVYAQRAFGQITVSPRPTGVIVRMIEDCFEEVQTLLPGMCDRCQNWFVRRYEMYWGAHPHFCRNCRQDAINAFNKFQKWPELEIPDTL